VHDSSREKYDAGCDLAQFEHCVDNFFEEDDEEDDDIGLEGSAVSESQQNQNRQNRQHPQPNLDLSSKDPTEWLDRAFGSQREATPWKLQKTFGDQSNMKLFHFAERMGDGCGLGNLVGQTFARTEHLMLDVYIL